MPTAEHIADVVNRYLNLVAKGSADDIVELYASDATVEDPVGGGEVHIGRQAIHGFYSAMAGMEGMERECELVSLRVAGHEAAFQFRLTVKGGNGAIRIEPIDVMVFNEDGKVAAMKAYWSATDVTPL
jgi:steroid delta-isomerase